jgi:hypothetical protein
MTVWKRRSDRAGRGILRSPGRPGVARREDRRRFWVSIAAGQSSEDAAVGARVSQAVGARWFREAGGMPPSTLAPSSKPSSGRYLSFAEREELAILRARSAGVREIARQMGRSASTISRELRRNAATRSGGLDYRATTSSGMPNGPPGARSQRSLRSTRRCGRMCRIGWPALSSRPAGLQFLGRRSSGKVADTDLGRSGVGLRRGARSRLLIACGSTFPMMRRCASATKPSTSRFMCKAVGLCAAS